MLFPGQMGDPSLFERAVEALLRVAQERTGVRPNVERGEFGTTLHAGSHQYQSWLQVQQTACSVRTLATRTDHSASPDPAAGRTLPGTRIPAVRQRLASWRQSHRHASQRDLRRSPGPTAWSAAVSTPTYTCTRSNRCSILPAEAFNTNWCLTNYTKADGCLAVVPESHQLRRNPRPGEAEKLAVPDRDAPACSVIVLDHARGRARRWRLPRYPRWKTWENRFPRVKRGLTDNLRET